MTVAIMTAAFVKYGDQASIIRPAFLILGALMIILIIILVHT